MVIIIAFSYPNGFGLHLQCVGNDVNNTRIIYFRYDIVIFQMIYLLSSAITSSNDTPLSSLRVLTLRMVIVNTVSLEIPTAFFTRLAKYDGPISDNAPSSSQTHVNGRYFWDQDYLEQLQLGSCR